jgi:hypothetical protein
LAKLKAIALFNQGKNAGHKTVFDLATVHGLRLGAAPFLDRLAASCLSVAHDFNLMDASN